MKVPRMTRVDAGRAYRVEFPYDPVVVDAIKRIVPAHSRTYDPAQKAWFVAPAYKDLVYQLLEDVYIEVEWGTVEAPEGDEAYRVLHLLPSAPKELVEASYKCLSKLYHPDVGGDHVQMQAINQAVFHLRRQLG